MFNNALVFLLSETELSVTAELVPTSSWNISSELDKGIHSGGHTGQVGREVRNSVFNPGMAFFAIAGFQTTTGRWWPK